MASIVFNLMTSRAGRLMTRAVLRYEFDPRCNIERGDVWERTDTAGEVTMHRVAGIRVFFGVNGEEFHVYMVPHNQSVVLLR